MHFHRFALLFHFLPFLLHFSTCDLTGLSQKMLRRP
jgi:hypothetical protein